MPRLRMSYSNRIFVYLPVGLLLLLVLEVMMVLVPRAAVGDKNILVVDGKRDAARLALFL